MLALDRRLRLDSAALATTYYPRQSESRVMLLKLSVTLAAAISMFFPSIAPAAAQVLRDTQLRAIQLVIAEAVLATNSQLSDRVGSPIKEITWGADMNERGWSLWMKGSSAKGPIHVGMSGFLWGGEADDWTATYVGGGEIGDERVQINGKLDWPFDKASADRLATNFKQVTKFGEHSVWAWVVGTEVIVGGTIGGVAGFAVTSAAGPLAVVVGLAGAIGGASATASVSNTIRSAIKSDKPTAPPVPPPAPTPGKDENLKPQAGMLYAAISKEGQVIGSGPDAAYLLRGTLKESRTGGQMSGQVIYQ